MYNKLPPSKDIILTCEYGIYYSPSDVVVAHIAVYEDPRNDSNPDLDTIKIFLIIYRFCEISIKIQTIF